MQDVQNRAFPQGILTSLHDVHFVCPLCRGELRVKRTGYDCELCEREFPLHAGIPDFRVFPDPFLNFQEDFDRTEIVLAGLEKYELEDLLKYYWSFSDITPLALRPNFIRAVMMGEERARHTVDMFNNGTFKIDIAARRVLEIGSGTGNFLAAAAGKYDRIIGTDIAMRWLHVSRRRFRDKGLPEPALVCCCAEFLPFADKNFDLVTSTSTLEFVNDQQKVLSECSRVISDLGSVHISSVNRYSLAKDPYAHLWGVGFFPYAWQACYVRWRRNAAYKSRTLSYRRLKNLIHSDFTYFETALPDINSSTLSKLSPLMRFQVHMYRFLKTLPFFAFIFRQFGPGWEMILRKKPL